MAPKFIHTVVLAVFSRLPARCQNPHLDQNPVELLKAIQKEHRLPGRDKANAKTLAARLKLQVDAFLKPYDPENKQRA